MKGMDLRIVKVRRQHERQDGCKYCFGSKFRMVAGVSTTPMETAHKNCVLRGNTYG